MDNQTIKAIKELSKEINAKLERRERYVKEAEGYLTEAKRDINVFNFLHKKEMSRAIYSLQQSIEKLTKSFLLLSGTLEPKQITRTHKAHVKLIDVLRKEWTNHFTYIANIENKGNKKELIEYIKNIDYSQVSKAEFKEIKNLIDRFNKLENEQRIDYFVKGAQKRLRDLNSYGRLSSFFKKPIKIDDEDLRNQIKYTLISMKIIILSIISCPHVESTRYHSNNKNDLKPDDYKKGLGIVDASSLIAKEVSGIIRELEKSIKELSKERPL